MTGKFIKARVTDRELDLFITKKHGWKTLPPDKVYAMALELKRLRFILAELGKTQERVNREVLSEFKKGDQREV